MKRVYYYYVEDFIRDRINKCCQAKYSQAYSIYYYWIITLSSGVFLNIVILQKTFAIKLDFFLFWKGDGGKLLFIDTEFQSS